MHPWGHKKSDTTVTELNLHDVASISNFLEAFPFSCFPLFLCLDHLGRLSFFFLKNKFIYFNWRLITLQYCIGFLTSPCSSLELGIQMGILSYTNIKL